jgi:hypothetical protein
MGIADFGIIAEPQVGSTAVMPKRTPRYASDRRQHRLRCRLLQQVIASALLWKAMSATSARSTEEAQKPACFSPTMLFAS